MYKKEEDKEGNVIVLKRLVHLKRRRARKDKRTRRKLGRKLRKINAQRLLTTQKLPFSSFERVFIGYVLLFASVMWQAIMEEVGIMEYVKDVHSGIHYFIHSGKPKLLH